MDNKLTLALIQHRCTENSATNLDRSIAGIRDAAARGAKLVLLQELHSTLYFCQEESAHNFDLAVPIPGPTTNTLSDLAKELDIVIVASLFEKRAKGLYHNTAVVLDTDKGIAGIYRKMHIPDDPGFYEKYYFTPGDYLPDANDDTLRGFTPIDTSVGKLGVLVCWDQWFPEAARLMTLAGAELLLYPTAIGWDEKDEKDEKSRQLEAWITIQRSHAIANGIPVAACNRTGTEQHPASKTDGIHFWGSSFVAGPQGEILAQASTDDEAILVASLDLKRSEEVRRVWPYLRDRRIDAYKDLLKRYRD
ncbi:carbon-nitrogen hydrolase [Kaarinaea lacus]